MKKLFLLLFLLSAVRGFAQTNLYVDSSISASGSGASWTGAYKTLNEALNTANAASTGKYVIHIAQGTYYPTGVQSGTNRDSAFFIARTGIKLYGGYQTGGALRDPYGYPTILSGNIGLTSLRTDNSRHVVVIAGISATIDTILVDGLQIRDGFAPTGVPPKLYNNISIGPADGGGMVIKKIACKVVVSDCRFLDDTSAHYAGAVYNEASATTFNHCGFIGNIAAGAGGALYINSDSNTAPVVINNSAFINNAATGTSGGCIYNTRNSGQGPGTIITNCQFGDGWSPNTANLAGGAIADISLNCAATSISGCSFRGNSALYGGAIFSSNTNVPTSGTAYIRNCHFLYNTATTFGGGLAISASGFSYTIDSSSFLVNRANNQGGGLYSAISGTGSIGNVSHCHFDQDSAASGGGAYSIGSTNFSSNRFTRNKAIVGAGLYNHLTNNPIRIHANTFSGNLAAQSGGGLFNRLSYSDTISNCLFSGNKAGINGGGIADSSASPTIIHCTFGGDSAVNGNGIWNHFSSPVISNSIIWEGGNGIANVNASTPAITYSTIQGGYPGVGNLSSDPLFISPVPRAAAPTISGDYTLIPCSPAIDSGYTSGSYTGMKDLAGNPRLYGPAVDQGAYEYSGAPFPLPIAGNSSICTGGFIQLSNPTPGGIWTSSNPAIATVNATGRVTTYSAGVDTITYSLLLGNCPATITKVITVHPVPVLGPITGSDTICSGSQVRFSATVSSIATYSVNWTSSDNTVAYGWGSGWFVGVVPGTTIIRCTVTTINGCVVYATKNLTVVPVTTPSLISGNNNYCLHDTVTLTDSVAGGIWISSDTNKVIIHATTGLFTALDTGTVTIIYSLTNSYGCVGTVSKSIHIDAVTATVTQNGFELSANDSNALYQWIDCDNGHMPVAGETGQRFTPGTNGQYAVIVSRGACTDTSACYSIAGLSIAGTPEENSIRIFPNPTSGTMSIVTTRVLPEYIILRDLTGRQLQRVLPFGNQTTIDLTPYPPGHYLVEVGGAGLRYRRLVTIAR